MADLALTAAQVAAVFPQKADIYTLITAASITAGQAVYVNSSGLAAVADATTAAKAKIFGIALHAAGSGAALSVLRRGHVYGFTISQAYNASIYVSDTAGALADAAGTSSKIVGRVVPLSDSTPTKVLFVDVSFDVA